MTPRAFLGRVLLDPTLDPPGVGGIDPAEVLEAASDHRVLLLAGWRLRGAGTLANWPPSFVAAYQAAEAEAAALDLARHTEIVRVLDALAAGGARALLFKGASLAYTHYPAAHLRVRADADLIVARHDVPALEQVLDRLGYSRAVETSGSLVSYQSHYRRVDGHGIAHALDVHWKISNCQAFADCFGFDELWQSRRLIPQLGPSAASVGDVHALLLGMIHRVAHHGGTRDLLWLYDLHLLATGLTAGEAQQLVNAAGKRHLGPIVTESLALVRQTFGATAIDGMTRALGVGAHARLQFIPRHQAGVLLADLGALASWRDRVSLLREHLFPPPAYMRARYGVQSSLWLPLLYPWRVVSGAPRWLSDSSDPSRERKSGRDLNHPA